MRRAPAFGWWLAWLAAAACAPAAAQPRVDAQALADCDGAQAWLDQRREPAPAAIAGSDPQWLRQLLRTQEGLALHDANAAARAADAAARAAEAAAEGREPDPEPALGGAEAVVAAAEIDDELEHPWLQAVIERRGLPSAADIGSDGMDALWQLLLSAQGDAQFHLRAAEHFLRPQISAPGSARMREAAAALDRALDALGRRQRYGTLFGHDAAGRVRALDSEDPSGLDARRAAVGLMPAALELCLRERMDDISPDPM